MLLQAFTDLTEVEEPVFRRLDALLWLATPEGQGYCDLFGIENPVERYRTMRELRAAVRKANRLRLLTRRRENGQRF